MDAEHTLDTERTLDAERELSAEPILEVEDLETQFRTEEGLVKAVDRVSFVLHRGETLGIVGESGCGKSVTNLSILQLLPARTGRITGGRVLFRDAGFVPDLANESIELGPGQLAVVGFGRYADPADDLGIENDTPIPRRITALRSRFIPVVDSDDPEGEKAIEATIRPLASGDLRIILRQRNALNEMMRSVSKKSMGDFFVIEATQNGKALPVEINYGKIIWTGLAWAVGEIHHDDIQPGVPIRLRLSSQETDPSFHLDGQVFSVDY